MPLDFLLRWLSGLLTIALLGGIVWDLPGLGKSQKPKNRDYSLEKYARDLEAVLSVAGNQPVVLLGHSMGGMILLTFCRLFAEHLGRRVAGLIVVDATYTNPLKTTILSKLLLALQKPVLEPLLYVSIALSPLLWFTSWLSYLNVQLSNSQIWNQN